MRPEFDKLTVTERIKLRDSDWRKRKTDGYSTEQADMDRLSDDYGVPAEILPKRKVGGIIPGPSGGLTSGGFGDF